MRSLEDRKRPHMELAMDLQSRLKAADRLRLGDGDPSAMCAACVLPSCVSLCVRSTRWSVTYRPDVDPDPGSSAACSDIVQSLLEPRHVCVCSMVRVVCAPWWRKSLWSALKEQGIAEEEFPLYFAARCVQGAHALQFCRRAAGLLGAGRGNCSRGCRHRRARVDFEGRRRRHYLPNCATDAGVAQPSPHVSTPSPSQIPDAPPSSRCVISTGRDSKRPRSKPPSVRLLFGHYSRALCRLACEAR